MKINFTNDAREILVFLNVKNGLSITEAECAADDALRLLAERFAGQNVYIAKNKFLQIDRDERIYAAVEYGGIPIRDIAARYGISHGAAHKAVCRMRAKFRT